MRLNIAGLLLLMFASGAAIAGGIQWFLLPENLSSGGLSGLAILIGYWTGYKVGLFYFALNVPILVWGWLALGRRFILLSMATVVSASVFMQILPAADLTAEPLLASIFGGVLIGAGTAIALRYGGSSGGFDIVATIISRRRDLPIGLLIFLLNLGVVAGLGFMKRNWDAALYSMLSMYLTGKVIDMIHTPHRKVTAFIVTNQTEKIAARLLHMPRGVTIMKTRGAFTNQTHDLLMTVATRYELAELRKAVREADPKAFVNIVQTVDVIGEFRRK